MAKQFFICRSINDGIKGSLDYIPGYNLNDKDCALVISNSAVYFYESRAKSIKSPMSPYIVKPRYNNQGRRWHLIHVLDSVNYTNNDVLKGYHFFQEAPDPDEPGFVFWIRNTDLCVKILNRHDRLKFFTLARFEEMTKIPNENYEINSPSLGKSLHKKIGVIGGTSNDLDGIPPGNISQDDYAVVMTGHSVYFYVARIGDEVQSFPNTIKPVIDSSVYWKLVGAVGDISFDQDTATKGSELHGEPPNPPPGTYVMWMSDGTGLGDSGDFLLKITNDKGETRYKTLIDFSLVGPGGVMQDPNKHFVEEVSYWEVVSIVDKSVEAVYQEEVTTHEKVRFVDHSGVFIDDFAYGDEDYESTQQIVIADYDEMTDTITYLEKVKYIRLYEYKYIFDQLGHYNDLFDQDQCNSIDEIYSYIYSMVQDQCDLQETSPVTTNNFVMRENGYYLEKSLFQLELFDQAYVLDNIVFAYHASFSEILSVQDNVTNVSIDTKINEPIIDIYETLEILYHIFIDDTTTGTISLSNNKQDITVVEKPQITIDTSTGILTPTIDAGVFRVSNGSDTHAKTDWVVLDEKYGYIIKNLEDSSNLTNFQVPNYALFQDKTYIIRARFHGSTLGPGYWDQIIYNT